MKAINNIRWLTVGSCRLKSVYECKTSQLKMLNILVYFLLIQVYFSLKKVKEILSQTKKACLKLNTNM